MRYKFPNNNIGIDFLEVTGSGDILLHAYNKFFVVIHPDKIIVNQRMPSFGYFMGSTTPLETTELIENEWTKYTPNKATREGGVSYYRIPDNKTGFTVIRHSSITDDIEIHHEKSMFY